jgi:hypothetical protein
MPLVLFEIVAQPLFDRKSIVPGSAVPPKSASRALTLESARGALKIGHAPSTVHRIWRAFGLQPRRAETFKLSSDPLFVEKVRDIVGLWLRMKRISESEH